MSVTDLCAKYSVKVGYWKRPITNHWITPKNSKSTQF